MSRLIASASDAELARTTELLQAALERNRQLEEALRTRIVIEQAKGVLCERLRVEPDVAFALLRRAARSSRRKLHELAAEVVGSPRTPPEVAAVLAELTGSRPARGPG
jgi:AmiR/NasT family two-component response regulator